MEHGTDSSKPKYAVPALEKTMAILDHLAGQTRGLTLSELHSELELPKTSVFSILQTLEAYNLIRKDNHGRFHLGLKLYSLGMASIRNLNSHETFLPDLERLRDDTLFTVHLCAYEKGETVCIEKLEGPGSIRFMSYVGERKRMNTSAVGKAIAAFLPESELQLVLSKGFSHLTPHSITTEPAFREHLEGIRRRGYAVDDEEGEIGVRCLGAPIFMEDGHLFGAVSLSTLKSHLPAQKYQPYADTLLQVGERLSRRLGYAGPYPLEG